LTIFGISRSVHFSSNNMQAAACCMQNMGLAAGHCGQAHVKKNGYLYLYFMVAPKNWLSLDLSTREGRVIKKIVRSDACLVGIDEDYLGW